MKNDGGFAVGLFVIWVFLALGLITVGVIEKGTF